MYRKNWILFRNRLPFHVNAYTHTHKIILSKSQMHIVVPTTEHTTSYTWQAIDTIDGYSLWNTYQWKINLHLQWASSRSRSSAACFFSCYHLISFDEENWVHKSLSRHYFCSPHYRIAFTTWFPHSDCRWFFAIVFSKIYQTCSNNKTAICYTY